MGPDPKVGIQVDGFNNYFCAVFVYLMESMMS